MSNLQKNRIDPLKTELVRLLLPLMEGVLTADQVYDLLVEPPNPDMGQFAFGVFPLAKLLKKAPAVIAGELASQIQSGGAIRSVQAAGPYLNFKLSTAWVGQFFLNEILNQKLFKQSLLVGSDRTMIEFSQPNTHKELHVGHMRNACLGDSLVKILRYSGVDVVSSTFPGDVGTHVAKCLWYLKYRYKGSVPDNQKGEWLGQMYSAAHLALESEVGTELEAVNRSQLTEILKQLEQKSGEFFDLWLQTRDWSIALMKEVYQWSGIEFDQWYWESEVDSDSVRYVKELYAEGKLVQSQGAIGMDLESEGLGFCLLLKSDGTGLYATKDLELARRKFQTQNIQKSIYVVDMRQALHFKQVFKVLEKIGFPQASDCYHLQYNFVELPDGAMSSRKGNIVPLTKLTKSMEVQIKSQFLKRYEGDWSSGEIDLCAHQVAQGAIKYGMLRMDTNKKIVFDMDEWLKIDGESGPFIQYSCARIQSLVEKNEDQVSKESEVQWELLAHPAEEKLIQHLFYFQNNVLLAAESYRPSVICTYLYELAKKFNHFYHECSIGQAESAQLKSARLALSKATALVLSQGLSLLGIPTPKRM